MDLPHGFTQRLDRRRQSLEAVVGDLAERLVRQGPGNKKRQRNSRRRLRSHFARAIGNVYPTNRQITATGNRSYRPVCLAFARGSRSGLREIKNSSIHGDAVSRSNRFPRGSTGYFAVYFSPAEHALAGRKGKRIALAECQNRGDRARSAIGSALENAYKLHAIPELYSDFACTVRPSFVAT